jgi:general secretion pathway protein E/type IV pilus assembly protein PilB
MAQIVAEQLSLPYLDLRRRQPDMQWLRRFNRNFCLQNRIFPVEKQGEELLVATSELPNSRMEQGVMRFSGLRPSFALAEEDPLVTSIYNYFFFLENPIEDLLQREVRALIADTTMTVSPDNFLQYLLLWGIKMRATDIHIRPMPQGISIAFRIDGVLRDMTFLPKKLARVVTAIKLQAGMDISEQRLPQDGRWTANLVERNYEIRVSTVVTQSGENVVLRLLAHGQAHFSLYSLGFLKRDLPLLRQALGEPFGLVLLTGPTGSGKSTTLVAGLSSMDLLDKNAITIENPVEYIVPLARQTQVNEAAGYDFSNAMRHFLRHDPDVILIGEMRDENTAQTALTAATTGHLVLSTLHSNTALGAIPRMQGLGVGNLTMAEALIAVICQRLVRTVCPDCAQWYEPTKEEKDYLGRDVKRLKRGQGCRLCNHSGYQGRTIIYEILLISKELRSLLERGAPRHELEKKAREQGFRSIFEVAVDKVESGETSVEEIQRILGRYWY